MKGIVTSRTHTTPIIRNGQGFSPCLVPKSSRSARPMQPLPRIPGYQLLDCLGGGPLTRVYAARETATDRPCAVKLIREEYADQSTAIKLLQREARAGLAVRHPHLVPLLDTHVTRPPYFLVMELLGGESL